MGKARIKSNVISKSYVISNQETVSKVSKSKLIS